jgi:signal transduction histidine kinase
MRGWSPVTYRRGVEAGRRYKGTAGAAVLAGVIQVVGARTGGADLGALEYVLLLAGPVALLARRRQPVHVLVLTVAAALGYAAVADPAPTGPYFLAVLFAIFAVGHRAATWVVAVAGYAGYLLVVGPPWRQAAVVAVAVPASIALAEGNRVRRQHFAEMMKYRAEQERAREEQERRQASEERLRIARELHDVLGHHLSLINVQAGVGLHLMDSRPEQAREALTAIKSASAEALREVRSVLGVLRPEDEVAPRGPAPGLARLAELTSGAGLPVLTEVDGDTRPLPAEVDRAAYRIVQEALTNVRRHAGGAASARVIIEYEDGALAVRVTDDGPGTASVNEAGNGIAGMRARAEALGGTLVAAPLDGGGFEVSARLPTSDHGGGEVNDSGVARR